jgi:hypothetical protein
MIDFLGYGGTVVLLLTLHKLHHSQIVGRDMDGQPGSKVVDII